ncbi:MAG: FAD-binding oxidoreductase [Gammaproteobacteria bacterium]|nr:FAD-binding oxidoreductase [Gammaproteobacteria bacterium]
MRGSLKKHLSQLFDKEDIALDLETLTVYGRDHTKVYTPKPTAVVFPRSIEQIQALVKMANQYSIPLVPSGGRTGLSGGAVACHDEVVVSFDKMKRMLGVNREDHTLTCEAGVITQVVKELAGKEGLHFPIDLASKGSSQIGGNIATNAGGVAVVRYGPIRQWVAGLKVVTGKGEVMTLNRGLIKNATGYDLRHLFVGSEGTLGFIVEATLWLAPLPKPSQVMVLGIPKIESVISLFHLFKSQLVLNAFEFFSENALAIQVNKGKARRPFPAITPYYVLLDFESEDAFHRNRALALFETAVERSWATDGIMSESLEQGQSLWMLREGIPEALASYNPYKNDLSVRVAKIPEFSQALLTFIAEHYPGFEGVLFGHIGDGNIHVNILKPETWETKAFVAACQKGDERLFSMIEQFGGSISAEHGIGLVKKPYLHYSKSPSEIEAMRSIKAVFDPKGIMNPGKIFDVS